MVAKETAALEKQQPTKQQYTNHGKLASSNSNCDEMGQPETPTDIQDVYF